MKASLCPGGEQIRGSRKWRSSHLRVQDHDHLGYDCRERALQNQIYELNEFGSKFISE